jgi:pilus assembly protein CpaB
VSRAVRTGSLLRAEDFASLEFAPADVPAGAQIDSPANRQDLVGAFVRHTVRGGQPILQGDLIRPGDHGFLALALSPGKRGLSVGVDMLSGVADLISPGDMVDVILTQTIREFDAPTQSRQAAFGVDPNLMPGGIDQNAAKVRRTCSETVLSNLRVIAVDQDLTLGGRVADSGANHPGQARSDLAHPDQSGPRTVTLELDQDEAQQLEIVRNVGRLSLAVISSDPSPGVRTASLTPVTIPISMGVSSRRACRDVLVSSSQRDMKPL